MKDFIKFFSIITGLFRSIISILLLFAIGFIVFVDTNLLLATFDLVGITNISNAFIKPLALTVTIIAFIINTIICRNIFKAGVDGKSHLANLFFGLLFLGVDVFLLFYLREKLLYILVGFNGLLVFNSLLGLIGNFRGIYQDKKEAEKKTEYIEVKSSSSNNKTNGNKISLYFDDEPIEEKEEVNIIKKDDTEVDGKSVIRTSQLIEEDTDLKNEAKEDYQIKNEIEEESLKEVESNPQNEEDLAEDIDNKKVNKVVEEKVERDTTYDPDLAEDFKKKEDAKIYDKSNFVRDED